MAPGEVLERALAGEYGELRGTISRPLANALTAMVARVKPKLCVEIGMAFGISTLAILEGLDDEGRLISIDPFQTEHYAGFGRALVARTDRADRHELIESPDYLALPRLLADGAAIDFAYVDGMHTFDYVALDAFYLDKLLPVGGVVGFNDCGFRSITSSCASSAPIAIMKSSMPASGPTFAGAIRQSRCCVGYKADRARTATSANAARGSPSTISTATSDGKNFCSPLVLVEQSRYRQLRLTAPVAAL